MQSPLFRFTNSQIKTYVLCYTKHLVLTSSYKVAQKERMDLSRVVEVVEVECRGGGPVVL